MAATFMQTLDSEKLLKLFLGNQSEGAGVEYDLKKLANKIKKLEKGKKLTIGRAPKEGETPSADTLIHPTGKKVKDKDGEEKDTSTFVSRRHCEIRRNENGVLELWDTSTNGTSIAGQSQEGQDGAKILDNLLEKLKEKNLSDDAVNSIVEQAKKYEGQDKYAEIIAFAKAKKENKEITYDEFKKQQTDTLVVGGEEENKNNDRAWLANKVAIWKELAQEKQLQLEHTDGDDKFSLLKGNERLGTVRYTSESNAEVSPDAKLEMYLGLVKDAAKSGKTITLGDKLTDAQKAMLLAATLMSTDKYKDGKKVALVNPPKIDTNAEYFKTLPDDVKKILEAHNRLQELQAQNLRIKDLLSDKTSDGKDKTDKQKQKDKEEADKLIQARRKEAPQIARDLRTDAEQARFESKVTLKEKVLAMRLGINLKDEAEEKVLRESKLFTTERTSGEHTTTEADRVTAAEKRVDDQFRDKDGNVDTAKKDAFVEALRQKYGKQNA